MTADIHRARGSDRKVNAGVGRGRRFGYAVLTNGKGGEGDVYLIYLEERRNGMWVEEEEEEVFLASETQGGALFGIKNAQAQEKETEERSGKRRTQVRASEIA